MSFIDPKKIISEVAIPISSAVVDFGFGKGDFLKYMAREVGPEGIVYAVDIQEELLKRVEKELRENGFVNVYFVNADLEEPDSTKIKDESVDFILISSLFFQVENKEAVIKEALRILKRGGRILFIDWKDSFSGIGPDRKLLFTEDDALLFFRDYPLSLERRLNSAGSYHYALVYRKN